MGYALDEAKERIVKYVSEHQDDTGPVLTQNRVTVKLMEISGSPNTFTQAFRELLDPKIDGRLQRVKVRKTIRRLALSKNEELLTEFKVKMKQVNNLLDVIEKFPEVGDCFEIGDKENIPGLTKFYLRQMRYFSRDVGYTVDYQSPKKPSKAYCLQARYDLLRTLPTFLVSYVNDLTNSFSNSVKEEAMKIIQPILFDSIKGVQRDYTKSTYFSDKYLESQPKILRISTVKANPLHDVPAEFLRILGRYYFLISKKLSKWKIDSCKEQKIISEFVVSFYPKSIIPNDKLSGSLSDEKITDYWFGDEKDRKQLLTKGMIKRLDKVHECLGGKFAHKFDKFRNNDRFVIAYFYNTWIFSLDILSSLEKRVIQTHFEVIEEDDRESIGMDQDEKLNEPEAVEQKNFIGKLYKTSKGKAAVVLDKEYSEVESHVGRWTRILIEE